MPLVLVEHQDGAAAEVSLQALAFCRRLMPAASLHAVLVGDGADEAAPALGEHGVGVVHIPEQEGLEAFAPDAWASILADLAQRLGATTVVAAGTERCNDVLARVAARLDVPLAANVVDGTAGETLSLTRVRWGGSLLEEARLHGPLELFTVQPHAVAAEPVGGPAPVVERFTSQVAEADLVVRVSERVSTATGGISLADAKVVVTGGRGVGSTEGFAAIEELAELLGGAVGCSRAVTSAGWRPHTDQVGQTGTKIAPDIYIPCGVSGATQHMAGCKGAKTILAVNTDPEASILASADYAVIGDLHEIVPAIVAELRKARGQ